jgi:hypothetical protein
LRRDNDKVPIWRLSGHLITDLLKSCIGILQTGCEEDSLTLSCFAIGSYFEERKSALTLILLCLLLVVSNLYMTYLLNGYKLGERQEPMIGRPILEWCPSDHVQMRTGCPSPQSWHILTPKERPLLC